jgi:hypothetical protein
LLMVNQASSDGKSDANSSVINVQNNT